MKQILSIVFLIAHTSLLHAFYSQVGQDQFLYQTFFKNKTNGVFVDIGAHDGVTINNTKFFEDLGWTGICFEPLEQPFKKLINSRNCICINKCVAPTHEPIKFIEVVSPNIWTEMLSGVASTYDPRHMARLIKDITKSGGSCVVKEMPSCRFNDVMREHGIYKIDYLSLDTEGNELEILKSIDFNTFYIFAITVENNYSIPDIKEFLTSRGFIFLGTLEQDEIYINSQGMIP